MPTEFQAALWRLLLGISTYCFWYGAIPRQSGRAAEPSVVSSEIGRTWWISVSESPKVYISSFLWKCCECLRRVHVTIRFVAHLLQCCMHLHVACIFNFTKSSQVVSTDSDAWPGLQFRLANKVWDRLGWQRLIYFNADNVVTCTQCNRSNYALSFIIFRGTPWRLQISAAATFPIPRNSLLMNCLTHRRWS